MLCVLCLINIGFVRCYSLGSWKFFARLCLVYFSVNFCYAYFASQTSGLCSAFPSLPVIFWQACFVLSSKILLCVLCLSNNCLCSINSLGSGLVFVRLFFPLVLFSEVFCYVCLASRSPVFVAGPLKFARFLALCYCFAYRSFPRLFFDFTFSHGGLKGCLIP